MPFETTSRTKEVSPMNFSEGARFPSFGMSDETAKDVLNFLSLDYPALEGFFKKTAVLAAIFCLGVLLGFVFWAGPIDPNRVTVSPLGYIPAFFMSYSMWMETDLVFKSVDKFKDKKKSQRISSENT
jgi:hypothetical protein